MSQQQPQRLPEQQPIKYGDVFDVSGELASEPIAPRDAAAAQAAENQVMGQVQKGGVASVMQSAADLNVRLGLLGRDEGRADEGLTISDVTVGGKRVITEATRGQVLGQYVEPAPIKMTSPAGALSRDAVTVGEALEATALSAGDKPVDQSDAAALQAAEARATGSSETIPGGIGATAQAAATRNTRTLPYEEKTKLADVLTGAADKLPSDKPATAQDAEGVTGAELRNKPRMTTTPGGVAESMAAAARLNQSK